MIKKFSSKEKMNDKKFMFFNKETGSVSLFAKDKKSAVKEASLLYGRHKWKFIREM